MSRRSLTGAFFCNRAIELFSDPLHAVISSHAEMATIHPLPLSRFLLAPLPSKNKIRLALGRIAVGVSALRNDTTGFGNIAISQDACNNNGSASFNTWVGWQTLFSNSAIGNTATGAAALFSNTTGSFNTANGSLALLYNTTGSSNVPS